MRPLSYYASTPHFPADIKFTRGNITDPSTGALVATILPGDGGQNGRVYQEMHYGEAKLALQWAENATEYMFWSLSGLG